MLMAKALGKQFFKRLTHHLLAWPAKHFFSRLVEKNNFLPMVHRDDGIHGRLQHTGQERGGDGQLRFNFRLHGAVRPSGQLLLDFLVENHLEFLLSLHRSCINLTKLP